MENFDVEILNQVNLKETFKEILDDYVMFDETFNTNPTMYECFSNYAFITKPDLKGKYLENYLIDLKQDVVEFFEGKSWEYNYETLENIHNSDCSCLSYTCFCRNITDWNSYFRRGCNFNDFRSYYV